MRYFLPALLLFLYGCGNTQPATEEPQTAGKAPAPALNEQWQSDTSLTTVESVYYDEGGDRLFTSNIEDGPWEADGQGSIGLLGLDGTVTDARWVTGLNAPKGMAMHDGKLFVADLDAVVEIDVASAAITERHVIPDATGLNDIDVEADGTLYVSDSKTGKVHRGLPGDWTVVADGMETPNGVLITPEGVLLGDTGAKTLSRLGSDGEREVLVEGVEPDGIVALADGGYLISRWGGEIHHVSEDWEATSIFTSSAEQDKTADLGYVPEQKLLLVPTFFGNRVVAYRVE